MSQSAPSTRLLFAASEEDANMLYATHFSAPDPFIYILHRGKSSLILRDLELDRGRREAQVDEVLSFSGLASELPKKNGSPPNDSQILVAYFRRQKISRVEVPANFPVSLADMLRRARITVRSAPEPFWPEREVKSPAEIRKLRQALAVTEAAMERAFQVLRSTKIGKQGVLSWGGAVLTSERLRAEIEMCIAAQGGVAANRSIVAGGEQAVDPHERGSGPLFANQLIVLDIFPRHAISGYFGDLTRTVVRGRATDAQKHLWDTCLQGQRWALNQIWPGASGAVIQEELKSFFAESGYPTERKNGRWSGFFHGAGHGLGLELHEYPRFAATQFQPRQVLTLEPGIYIPGLGGVRHEDVLQITNTGKRLLTQIEKPLEL